MVTVKMKSGRFWWWIRSQNKDFPDIAEAFCWAAAHADSRKWYRYRMLENGKVIATGGNF